MHLSHFVSDDLVGNTPAKLLIKQVPVHQSVANVLLLGCGDPRHILYTSWCIQQAGGLSQQQILSVTTCDVEPSTIARNIILYRLIQDASNFQMVWSIFYDRLIDGPCMDLLVACATNLYAVGESLEAWQETAFGAIVKFVDEHTYAIVRKIWAVYARGKVSEELATKMEKCVKDFRVRLGNNEHEIVLVSTAAAQALPCQSPAYSNLQVHSNIFHAYAATGRSPHCSYPSRSSSTTSNPTMFRGTDQHADLHYCLDPTLGFHLAAAYAQLKDGPLYSKSETTSSGKVDERRIFEICIHQFSGWCHALKKSMEKKNILIHNFAGDLFDLSHAIIHTRKNGDGRSRVFGSLRGGSIHVLPGVPLEYDVIDTSNVSDHVGLLNLLLACRELLGEGEHTTLYTLFLNQPTGTLCDRDILLSEMLRTDLPTFAAMTGLTLLDTASHVSTSFSNWTQFNVAPLINSDSRRVSVTLEWTYVRPSAVRVNLEHQDFVEVFTDIYKKMFEFNLSIPRLDKLKEYVEVLKSQTVPYAGPSMQTFVQFVLITTKNLHCVESRTIIALIESVLSLRYALQLNQTSSLLAWFTAVGLILPADATRLGKHHLLQRGVSILGPNPPEVILLTVLIPKVATVGKLDKMDTPLLEMSVQTEGSDDRFSSLQVQYISKRCLNGTSKEISDCNTVMELSNFALIEGDISNYKFLACTTIVPASCLLGEDVQIGLSLPGSMYRLSTGAPEIVGASGVVYNASLRDKKMVSFSAYTPEKYYVGRETGQDLLKSESGDMKGATWAPMTASVKDKRVVSYSTKVDLQNTDFFKAGGMKLCTPDLNSSTILRVTVQLQKGQRTQALLPVAVKAINATVQISRKGGFLNVLFPLAKGITCPTLSMSKTCSVATQFNPLCTSRVLLDCMPKLDLTANEDSTEWLYMLAGAQISQRERQNKNIGPAQTAYSMKETIHCILLNAIGRNEHIGGKRLKFFALMAEGSNSPGIYLFVNSVRLNFDDGSVLIDAAVNIPTTRAQSSAEIVSWHTDMVDRGEQCLTNVSSSELVAWKKALPAMCERTRNTWQHSSSCEYVSSGTDTIPLNSTISRERVVCSCCQGKGLEGSEFEKEVGTNHPLYKQSFRVAISPFFNTGK